MGWTLKLFSKSIHAPARMPENKTYKQKRKERKLPEWPGSSWCSKPLGVQLDSFFCLETNVYKSILLTAGRILLSGSPLPRKLTRKQWEEVEKKWG